MEGNIITDLFELLSNIILGLFTSLGEALTGITNIFYVQGTGFSLLGTLLLIGLGMFFVMFAWRVVQGFIRNRG